MQRLADLASLTRRYFQPAERTEPSSSSLLAYFAKNHPEPFEHELLRWLDSKTRGRLAQTCREYNGLFRTKLQYERLRECMVQVMMAGVPAGRGGYAYIGELAAIVKYSREAAEAACNQEAVDSLMVQPTNPASAAAASSEQESTAVDINSMGSNIINPLVDIMPMLAQIDKSIPKKSLAKLLEIRAGAYLKEINEINPTYAGVLPSIFARIVAEQSLLQREFTMYSMFGNLGSNNHWQQLVNALQKKSLDAATITLQDTHLDKLQFELIHITFYEKVFAINTRRSTFFSSTEPTAMQQYMALYRQYCKRREVSSSSP